MYLAHRTVEKANFEADPSTDDGAAGDWCGGGVDEEGQFFARDAEAVSDRPHSGADDEGIGVVVEEDGQTQKSGGHSGRTCAGGFCDQQFGDTACASCQRDYAHHADERGGEAEDEKLERIAQRRPDEI